MFAVTEQRGDLGQRHIGLGQVPLREILSGLVLDGLKGGALFAQASLQGARMHVERPCHLLVAARACPQKGLDRLADLNSEV